MLTACLSLTLAKGRSRFDAVLGIYRLGNTKSDTPALAEEFTPTLDEVENTWRRYRNDIEVILGGKQAISEVRELYQVIDSFIPQMLTNSDEVVGEQTSWATYRRQRDYGPAFSRRFPIELDEAFHHLSSP